MTKSSLLLLCTALLLLVTGPVRATESERQSADWEARLSVAEDKQRRGSKMKAAADSLFESEQAACAKTFFVTDCQRESRLRYNQSTKAATALEAEGRREERQVRKEQRDDKDARRAAEAPKREADLRARAAEVARDRAEAEAAQTKRLADKAAQTEQGRQRRAEAAERQQLKQQAHQEKVQKRLERAARQQAEQPEAASQ